MACSNCSSEGGCSSKGCGGNGKTGGGCGSTRKGTNACPSLHTYDWITDTDLKTPNNFHIVEVRFKGGRKDFYYSNPLLATQTGDYVIVSVDKGEDFGTVHLSGQLVRLRLKSKNIDKAGEFPEIIRVAKAADLDRWDENKDKDAEAFLVGRRMIDEMNLPMKVVDVEWQFDHNKVTFYFTAENRVDFRQLVRNMASKFKARVELRQIGARDEAARIGGIGSCGRELCCSTWLQEFVPVSASTARIQNLPMNPAKLSGQCGRLKCCLNYELEQYMDALRAYPPIGQQIRMETGLANIRKIDIFKSQIWVLHDSGKWESRPAEEVRQLLKDTPTFEQRIIPPEQVYNARRRATRSRRPS